MKPISKTKMLMYQSKSNLDKKICFGKITIYHLDPEIREMLARNSFGRRIPHSILVHDLIAIEIKFYF